MWVQVRLYFLNGCEAEPVSDIQRQCKGTGGFFGHETVILFNIIFYRNISVWG